MTIDLLTFFAIIIKALAWPVAAVIMVFLFKNDLRDVFERIRKGKVGGVELELAEKVAAGIEFAVQVKEAAEDNVLPVTAAPEVVPPAGVTEGEYARASIISAWLTVESAVTRLTGRTNRSGTNSLRSMRWAEAAGIISPEDMSLYYDLRALRNQAAHKQDFTPTPDAATTFVQLATSLTKRLDSYAQGDRFVIRRRSNGEYSFSLRGANGYTILESEGYSAKASVFMGIEAARQASQIDDRYQRKTGLSGAHMFNLLAANGQVIGSSERYVGEASRDAGIEAVKKYAPVAAIDDLAP